jgi:hypothetical protein
MIYILAFIRKDKRIYIDDELSNFNMIKIPKKVKMSGMACVVSFTKADLELLGIKIGDLVEIIPLVEKEEMMQNGEIRGDREARKTDDLGC